MCGRPYLDTMHADHAHLIIWYFSIQWSDLETRNTVATVWISRSFLWYAMNDMMHVIQRKSDACNARTNWCMWCNYDFWGTWIGYSSHSPWLNHGYKIKCPHTGTLHPSKAIYIINHKFHNCHRYQPIHSMSATPNAPPSQTHYRASFSQPESR